MYTVSPTVCVGFKILSTENLRAVSLNIEHLAHGRTIFYRHRFVEPKPHCGPFAVFKELTFLQQFRGLLYEDCTVWEILYREALFNDDYENEPRLWVPGKQMFAQSLPPGTVLAARLKLVRILGDREIQ